MNIAKALKEKNRIAGRIKKLQTQMEKYNRQQSGIDSDFNAADIFKALQEEWAHLINLKSKIALANVGISDKLVRLSEAKAELVFWVGFDRYAGKHNEPVAQRKVVNGQYEDFFITFDSYITSKEVQDHVDRVQKLIEDLQDEVDSYNATTSI